MDGYSVQEAASVLGVAEGRVWELLARGVISGTPDGDSMRVFLKAQAGPIATAGAREEPPRTNGNGGSHAQSGEASAFRELLTEFRNLTERYGQALLALGEARGEVAGLRSRVDLLEARLDLRVAAPLEAATIAWEAPAQEAPAPEPAAATVAPASAPSSRTSRPRKRRTTKDAMAGFNAALARAQDPGVAGVAAARAAELDQEAPSQIAPEPVAIEEPETPLIAEPEPAAAEVQASEPAVAEGEAPEPAATEVEAPAYSPVFVEPDWFADGDFAWLDAAEIESRGRAEAVAEPELIPSGPEPVEAAPEAVAEPEPIPSEPEPVEAAPEPFVEAAAPEQPPVVEAESTEPQPAAPEPMAEAASEAIQDAFEPIQVEPPPAPEPEVEPQPGFESWRQVEPEAAQSSSAADAASAPEGPSISRATVVGEADTFVEEEVMWLGADTTPSSAPPDPSPDPHIWPVVDRVQAVTTPVAETIRPPLAMTEDELTRLALDEGWDEAEVAAIRAMITPPPRLVVDLPGGSELDEAMAALDAVPIEPDAQSGIPSRQWVKPAADEDQPRRQDPWAFEAEPPAALPPRSEAPGLPDQDAPSRPTPMDLGWLRRRPGPAAASAYRRLRRLFPG